MLGALLVLSASGCAGGKQTTTAAHRSTGLVLGRRIGPISLYESKAKIEAAYGKGRRLVAKSGQTVTFYPAISIGVQYYGSQGVGVIETSSPRYRTQAGFGVGNTVARARKLGAACSRQFSSCSATAAMLPPEALPASVVVIYLNRKPSPTDRGVRVAEIDYSLAG